MAKDHRPDRFKDRPHRMTPDGTMEARVPPSSNSIGQGPTKMLRPKTREEWTPDDERRWVEYWDKQRSEWESWEDHYRRSKWEVRPPGT